MKRKGVRVMVGLVLICLLAGMLGLYSASGWNDIGLTYRRPIDNWGGSGGVKFYTQSNFGGELLVDYSENADEYGKSTYLSFQSSLLYRLEGSSNTSPYVGIGYLSTTDVGIRYLSGYNGWGSEFSFRESGFALLAGMEHFFSKNFSIDLRATAYFNTWKDTWYSSEDHGSRNALYIDMGISMYL